MSKIPGWDKMSEIEKQITAVSLFNSERGLFIMAEALYRGIQDMRRDKYPADSDIEDMETLSILFEPYFTVQQIKFTGEGTLEPQDVLKFRNESGSPEESAIERLRKMRVEIWYTGCTDGPEDMEIQEVIKILGGVPRTEHEMDEEVRQ